LQHATAAGCLRWQRLLLRLLQLLRLFERRGSRLPRGVSVGCVADGGAAAGDAAHMHVPAWWLAMLLPMW
jgi:hypothetical protein